MAYPPLHSFPFNVGFNASLQRLADEAAAFSAEGSSNTLILGDGYRRPVKAPATQGAGTGSRIMCPIGKTWGGIKDGGGTTASGSVFEDIGRSLWGIGAGQVHSAGTNVSGFTLSTLLKLVLLSGGVYGSPITAGLAQPSAPSIGVTTSTGNVSGAISIKLERRRNSTGARSVASPTSAVVVPEGKKIRVTFPLALTGQTHWRVFATVMGFGGTGVHYAVPYSGSIDIAEAAVAAGTVDSIARSLEFDWKDGDLVPIEASYDDYAPPAGTHAIRLENAMCVAGCYAEASAAPLTSGGTGTTVTSTGTSISVSKPNAYESHIPTHLLLLPEQIVDVLSRPIDSYGLIACQNSIHALQYVGYRGDDLPACAITTILPDTGIQYPHNWVQFRGRLALYTAEGNLLLMGDDGAMDTSFAAPVKRLIAGWTPADTVLGYDPANDLLLVMNGLTVLCFSFQKGGWSDPVYLQDYGVSGAIRSAQTSQRKVYFSIESGGAFTAYQWDASAAAVQIASVSHFITQPDRTQAKNLYELSVALENKRASAPVVAVLGRNQQKLAFRKISVTSGTARLYNSTEQDFTAAMVGKKFVAFGVNIGGAGVHFISGLISSFVSASELAITNAAGGSLTPSATLSNILIFIGDWVGSTTTSANAQHLRAFYPRLTEAKSYALGLWTYTNGDEGAFTEATIFGTVSSHGRVNA